MSWCTRASMTGMALIISRPDCRWGSTQLNGRRARRSPFCSNSSERAPKAEGFDPLGVPLISIPLPRLLTAEGPQNYRIGTLKIAIRHLPRLIVSRSVAAKTRFRPVVVAKRQPLPRVIRSPFFALFPLMTISFAI